MVMQDDARSDFVTLGHRLAQVLADLEDPKARVSGSDAASLARTRRVMGATADELAEDYDVLGEVLGMVGGAGAAAVANERRMIRKALDALREPDGTSKVAELASFRAARAKAAGTPARRRKSG